MSLALLNNIAANRAHRSIMTAGSQLTNAIERLSTGRRINSAKDDAAGVAISSKMNAHIRSLGAATINAHSAVSFVETMDQAHKEHVHILERMRTLAVQGSTEGTLTSSDRDAMNQEYYSLGSEFDRISDSVQYNGQNLLAENGNWSFQVGIMNTDNDRLTLTTNSTHVMGLLTEANYNGWPSNPYTKHSLGTASRSQLSLKTMDILIQGVLNKRAALGAFENRAKVSMGNLSTYRMNLSAAHSRITDADVATEMQRMTTSRMLADASVSVMSQANAIPGVVMSLLG